MMVTRECDCGIVFTFKADCRLSGFAEPDPPQCEACRSTSRTPEETQAHIAHLERTVYQMRMRITRLLLQLKTLGVKEAS